MFYKSCHAVIFTVNRDLGSIMNGSSEHFFTLCQLHFYHLSGTISHFYSLWHQYIIITSYYSVRINSLCLSISYSACKYLPCLSSIHNLSKLSISKIHNDDFIYYTCTSTKCICLRIIYLNCLYIGPMSIYLKNTKNYSQKT